MCEIESIIKKNYKKTIMKKITILAAVLLTSTMLFAQSIEITPIFGYTFSGQVDGYYGVFDVKDDMSYGGILSVEVDHMSFVELSYQRNDTRVVTSKYYEDWSGSEANMAVEHYQVGMLREFKEGKVAPFAKLSLGTTRYVQTSKGNQRYWLFSLGAGIGAKILLTDRIGLRLHGNLMMPLEFAGGGLFCGIGSGGSGCSTNVAFNVPLVHWDMGVGLIFRLQD